jgi:hypothetical protein
MAVAVEINLYGTNVPGKSVKLNLDKKHHAGRAIDLRGAPSPQFTQMFVLRRPDVMLKCQNSGNPFYGLNTVLLQTDHP